MSPSFFPFASDNANDGGEVGSGIMFGEDKVGESARERPEPMEMDRFCLSVVRSGPLATPPLEMPLIRCMESDEERESAASYDRCDSEGYRIGASSWCSDSC